MQVTAPRSRPHQRIWAVAAVRAVSATICGPHAIREGVGSCERSDDIAGDRGAPGR